MPCPNKLEKNTYTQNQYTIMKKLLILALALISVCLSAQVNLEYQKPSKEILDLVDVPMAPSVRMDNNKEYMVLLYRDAFKTIAELSKEELRLGGLRIAPRRGAPSWPATPISR